MIFLIVLNNLSTVKNRRRETTKTMAEYEIENKHLKDMVDQLSLRVSQMEKVRVAIKRI